MTDDQAPSEAKATSKVIRAPPPKTGPVLDIDRRNIIAQPPQRSPIEFVAIGDLSEGQNDLPADYGVVRLQAIVGLSGQERQNIVENSSGQQVDGSFRSALSIDEHYTVALLRFGIKFRNNLGSVLQV